MKASGIFGHITFEFQYQVFQDLNPVVLHTLKITPIYREEFFFDGTKILGIWAYKVYY